MMAVLETILPAVARSSGLSLELYRVAASCQTEAAKDLITAASAINNFASIVKQIGTIIKEDDRLPSSEVSSASSFYAKHQQPLPTFLVTRFVVLFSLNTTSQPLLGDYDLSRRRTSRVHSVLPKSHTCSLPNFS
jgi:hypothetical protein